MHHVTICTHRPVEKQIRTKSYMQSTSVKE